EYDPPAVSMVVPYARMFVFERFDYQFSVEGNDAPTFGDLFAEVFAQRGTGHGSAEPVRGVDLHQTVTLEFEDAIAGGQRSTTILRQERCRMCHGSGSLSVNETQCRHCHGAGVVKSARGHMVFSKPCAHCGGAGAL